MAVLSDRKPSGAQVFDRLRAWRTMASLPAAYGALARANPRLFPRPYDAPMFLERALHLLAAFIAHWGSAKLVADCRQAPLGYWKPMAASLREIESLARRAIYDLAQTLKVRAFAALGPRQAKIPVES
jgi:hypothetical protein